MSSVRQAFDSARAGADLGALALALQRRDADAGIGSIDWQALLGALLLSRDPEEALATVQSAQTGFRALLARTDALGLGADQVIAALGVNIAQARMLAARASGLVELGASPSRLASVFDSQARHLVAQRIAAISLRPTPVTRPFHAIDSVEADLGPKLSGGLRDALQAARASIDLDALTAAVEARNLSAVVAELPLDLLAASVRSLSGEFRAAYLAGASAGYSRLGGNPDLVNASAADAWAEARIGELGGWIRGSAEAAAREVIGSVEAFGADAAGVAALVRDRIGLTARDAGAAAKRYTDVLATGASHAEASAAASGYAEALESTRLTAFGPEQSYGAANAGQRAGWSQAQREGLVSGVSRYWIDREDADVCPVCYAMGGQRRGVDEPFYSDPARGGDGGYYMDPGDPHRQCRCAALAVTFAASKLLADAA